MAQPSVNEKRTDPGNEEAMITKEITGDGMTELYIDPVKEKILLAKLDLFFTPVIMLVYLSCFLDRTNIGNVKVAGMPEDIGASAQQFSTAVSIFYATYVTFETPFAILLKKLTPRVLLTSLCIVWSLTTIFSGFIHNVAGLYASRLVLGACEAGLFPSLTLYLTMVYRREEQAKRVAYLFSCTALSGAFGGLLAYALLMMDGVAGYAGWRWVYIIEGVFSTVIAVAVWFGLPTNPAEAWFLTPEQKAIMVIRQKQTAEYLGGDESKRYEFWVALKDPKLYLSAAIQWCQDILLYGFSTFLPAILKAAGHNSLQSNYLTVPVYIFGAIAFIIAAVFSDRLRLRSPFILFANIFGIAGYIILLTVSSNGVKYFATFLCAVAVYNGPGLNVTWINVNVAPHYRRATTIGVQQTIANTAGIVAGQIYRTSPYRLGHSFSLGALALSQVLIVIKILYVRNWNLRKEKIASGQTEDNRKVKTGDRALDFKYHL
ncbi:putative transporter [Cyphellophora attinorum]|uniref:Putative transporter n=1 Tax=Cyphellophora attinorum TaxID=1664694 RepID=A0A0N1H4A5_9EURO|nr:putative transporter [Phialophora attinorum]KPI35992.1 putative transporter [Phialophora attinorum]